MLTPKQIQELATHAAAAHGDEETFERKIYDAQMVPGYMDLLINWKDHALMVALLRYYSDKNYWINWRELIAWLGWVILGIIVLSGKPVMGNEIYSPVGSVINRGVYWDVYTHTPATGRRMYGSRELNCHEWVHHINMHLFNESGRKPSYYLGKGEYIQFDAFPNVGLTAIGRLVAQKDRDSTWEAYFPKSAPDWEKYPGKILDEWTAYRLDRMCVIEEGGKDTTSRDNLPKFSVYGDAYIRAVEEYDPEYKEKDKLIKFIRFLQAESTRLRGIIGE